jgi:hypothetical protein
MPPQILTRRRANKERAARVNDLLEMRRIPVDLLEDVRRMPSTEKPVDV